ncbi:Pycsar system effector family protein [Umezawaea sp. NPDC059074]|uniref:Pycsar system effector family protein n=1 Tax=Umezawaea sp. NPDC059074 TaxID=3346716 RepID=UPI00367F873F
MNATSEVPAPEITAVIDQAAADVNVQLARADTKASTLLPLFGAFLAGVVALSTRPMPTAAVVLLWVAAVLMLGAVLVLLLAVRPRFGNADPFGFPRLARFVDRPGEVLNVLVEDTTPLRQAKELCGLAVIVRAKYVRVRLAVDLIVAGLVSLAGSRATAQRITAAVS